MGGLIGFHRGFTKQLITTIGFLVIIVLAFILKNPLSIFLYEHLPFFEFGGLIKGVTVLNILLYELIAFLLVAFILSIIWHVVLFASTIFEKILNATIILGIPSKLLGMLLGIIEYFIIVFIGLYILSLPFFNIKEIKDSTLSKNILSNTPILSNITFKKINALDEFKKLQKEYKNSRNVDKFNYDALNTMMKYDIIDVESVNVLVEKKKLKITGINNLIEKYEEDKYENNIWNRR